MGGPSTKLGFRQRIRERFKSDRYASSPLPSLSLPADTVSTTTTQSFTSRHQSNSNLPANDDILSRTLQHLSNDERTTLRDQFLSNSQDIDVALDDAWTAAKEKQRCCIEKRWTFTFGGRSIILKDEAEKIVRWLDRFKAVGDIAANADPVHTGLPWAGIRLLLEVRIDP